MRRLTVRIANGECPSEAKDPLIADYSAQLKEVLADILGHDLMTQDVLDRRLRFTSPDLMLTNRILVLEAVYELRQVTKGRLNTALLSDAEVVTTANVDLVERKVSAFRLAGRALRIVKWAGGTAIAGGGGVIYGSDLMEAVPKLLANPAVQSFINLIMKMLGLG